MLDVRVDGGGVVMMVLKKKTGPTEPCLCLCIALNQLT